jgi:ABC-type multidrug transport system fused ATPase/permease subunit
MMAIRKLWSLLTPGEKASASGLVGLMLVSMVLEMIGIGLIVPALGAMSGEAPLDRHPAVAAWLAWLGHPTQSQLILGGLTILLAIYAFKAAFLLFVSWRQLRFVASFQERVARQLFGVYLTQPWTFHLQRHSGTLIRTLSDITNLAHTLTAILSSVAEMLVVAGIMVLFLWFEPVGALAVGVILGVATWLLDRVTRKRLTYWGKMVQHHAGQGYKHMFQGLHGAKDVKVLGCEQDFVDQFALHRSRHVRMLAKQAFAGQIPRLWFELLAVASLCLLTAVMVWQGKPTQAMIPTLGLFAAGAFRLLPSVNRLSNSFQSLRFTQSLIDTVTAELALGQAAALARRGVPMAFRTGISLENVSYRYPTGHADALSDVSLTVPHGSSVGLVGGSGAGKSTLVDIILGLLDPSSGRVTVDGVDIGSNVRGWQDQVGYVPQSIFLCDDTLRRNVAFGIPDGRVDEEAVRRALRAAQLEDFVAQLPQGLDTTVGERGMKLSGGQRQRIGIARALYHDPQVLVLDEATSALDTETEKGVMEAVNALHGAKTLIIIAHRLTTVANCDLLYKLENGRVAQSGSFAEVVSE